jgi:hypothetical protein
VCCVLQWRSLLPRVPMPEAARITTPNRISSMRIGIKPIAGSQSSCTRPRTATTI